MDWSSSCSSMEHNFRRGPLQKVDQRKAALLIYHYAWPPQKTTVIKGMQFCCIFSSLKQKFSPVKLSQNWSFIGPWRPSDPLIVGHGGMSDSSGRIFRKTDATARSCVS